jgi:hypothetical protein
MKSPEQIPAKSDENVNNRFIDILVFAQTVILSTAVLYIVDNPDLRHDDKDRIVQTQSAHPL